MKSSKAPALATWLVEHLIPGDRSETLAGDLLEQFSQGRSAAWYWRQVLVAILVGFSKELRILWMAVGFTLVWISALSLFYGRIWTTVLPWAMTPVNTTGFLTVVNAVPLPVALSIHLWAMRSFSLQRFSRGLCVGLFVLVLGTALGSILLSAVPRSPEASFFLARYSTSPWHHSGLVMYAVATLPSLFGPTVAPSLSSGLVIYAIATLPVFFALLLSMWAARPNNPHGEISGISV